MRWPGFLVMLPCVTFGCAAPGPVEPGRQGPRGEDAQGTAPTGKRQGRVLAGTTAPRGIERIAAGHVLVELRSGTSFPPASDPQATGAALPLDWELGGTSVRHVRTLFAERNAAAGRPARGPLLLLATRSTDEAGTRADVQRIAADPRVYRAEPDRIRQAAKVPNDKLYPMQWNLQQIDIEAAWDRTTGSPNVVVAVLDTGIVMGHPDLQGRLLPGYDFISDPANSGNGTGRNPDPTDYGDTSPESSGYHGTHVSGTIGAMSNNGIGVTGIDWQAKIMPVRVLGVQGGTGTDSDIADAINWSIGEQVGAMPLAQQTADVLNMSFGGLGISFTLQSAVDDAIAHGSLVVAAAGNLSDDAANYSPGGLDGVVTVAATQMDQTLADYSNYGARVDLLAPGGGSNDPGTGDCPDDGIWSTYKDIGTTETGYFTYCTLEGTSQATPQVSGTAALVRSIFPVQQLTFASLLRSAANHKVVCDAGQVPGGCGAGLLDVDNTLVLAQTQLQCDCSGDLLCLDGTCIEPGYPHVSIFADPVVRAGCQAAPAGGPAAAGLPGWPGLAALLALAAATLGRRRRQA